MAKHAALFLVLAIALTLSACGGTNEQGQANEPVAEVEQAAEPTTVLVSPDAVLQAFAGAGLEPPNPRDNTDNMCDASACSEWITTDILSITLWDTVEDAEQMVAASSSSMAAIRIGDSTTTVRFQTGGSTPEYDRAAYEAVLAELGAGSD